MKTSNTYYIFQNSQILSFYESKRVILELGTGLGLLGLNCLKLKPKQYIFTDFHYEVLNQLKRNLCYNYNESNIATVYDKDKDIIVDRLDWCNLDECELLNKNKLFVDLILASGIKSFCYFYMNRKC